MTALGLFAGPKDFGPAVRKRSVSIVTLGRVGSAAPPLTPRFGLISSSSVYASLGLAIPWLLHPPCRLHDGASACPQSEIGHAWLD